MFYSIVYKRKCSVKDVIYINDYKAQLHQCAKEENLPFAHVFKNTELAHVVTVFFYMHKLRQQDVHVF